MLFCIKKHCLLRELSNTNIKETSPTCFSTSLPSSGRPNVSFKMPIATGKLLFYQVLQSVAASLLTLIKYKRCSFTDFRKTYVSCIRASRYYWLWYKTHHKFGELIHFGLRYALESETYSATWLEASMSKCNSNYFFCICIKFNYVTNCLTTF